MSLNECLFFNEPSFFSAGHWRIFESQDPNRRYDDSHLIVMRELKEEDGRKPGEDTGTELFPLIFFQLILDVSVIITKIQLSRK